MSKLANYLQEHLRGGVISAPAIRDEYARDESILALTPEMVVFPYNISDIRKLARFTWQLAEKGHILPITARGNGTDTTGAAIGKGVSLVFPAHMNNILELDTKQRLVRVQPGLLCGSLQMAMMTHGYRIPALEDAPRTMTIGGAIANNYAGGLSSRYGSMRDWVEQVEMVLANGEVIQTGRINKRELEKRKGLPTLEGEIYRQVDGIIMDNPEPISEMANALSNVGYALDQVKQRDGSFDLLPLVMGSQGTLGLVSEVILRLDPFTPQAELVVAAFSSLAEAHDALDELRKLQPSRVEMLDGTALQLLQKQQPTQLVEIIGEEVTEMPAALYFIEFDDKHAGKKAKKVQKQLSRNGSSALKIEEYDQRKVVWQFFYGAVAQFKTAEKEGRIGLPIMNDVGIPDDKFQTYLEGVAALGKKYRTAWPVVSHVLDGQFSMWPLFDLRKVNDRQKALKLMDEYYTMTAALGGVVATSGGEGRLHGLTATKQYSEGLFELFTQVRIAFDPYGTLNPGVKQAGSIKDTVAMLRSEYAPRHIY